MNGFDTFVFEVIRIYGPVSAKDIVHLLWRASVGVGPDLTRVSRALRRLKTRPDVIYYGHDTWGALP